MKTVKKFVHILIFLSFFLSVFARPQKAYACSCPESLTPLTMQQEFEKHDAVFTGTVIRKINNHNLLFSAIEDVFDNLGYSTNFIHRWKYGLFWGYSVFINVTESWKGVSQSVVQVDTGYGHGDCGYEFDINQQYIIYANYANNNFRDLNAGNYLITGICNRNAELLNATEDLEYLNKIPNIPIKFTLPILINETQTIYFSLFIIIIVVVFAKRWRKTKY